VYEFIDVVESDDVLLFFRGHSGSPLWGAGIC
jgi:hypothetical protein